MEFTGERYVPSEDGQIKYEHLHRYALCLPYVSGKSVLDLASGEGYGAALMSPVAKSVLGVDISAEIVLHARRRYYCQNLTFIVGSCDKVPLPDASVDVVTSFETIEHHDKHEQMMQEIARVLRPGGILIISSPNRLTYSDEPSYSNPFHIKELYFDEFSDLLSRYFKRVQFYGQRLATGSFVYSLRKTGKDAITAYSGNIDQLTQAAPALQSPIYFIAVCSNEALIEQICSDSIYIDEHDDLLKRANAEKIELATLLQDHRKQIEELKLYQDHLQQAIETIKQQLEHMSHEKEQLSVALTSSRSIEAHDSKLSIELESRTEEVKRERELRGRLEDQLGRQVSELARQEGEIVRYSQELASKVDELATKSEELARRNEEIIRKTEESARKSEELTSKDEELAIKIEELVIQTAELLKTQSRLELSEATEKQQAEALSNKTKELSQALVRLRQHETEVKVFGARIDDYDKRLSASLSRVSEMETQLLDSSARLDSKKEILDWMRTSRSWKLTSPLRKLSLLGQQLNRRLPQTSKSVIHGFVDSPADNATVSEYLEVCGWAFSTEAPVARVDVFVDNIRLGEVSYGIERLDVVNAFQSQVPAQCGFARRFFLDELLTGRRNLMVRVTNLRGDFEDYFRTITVEEPAPPAAIVGDKSESEAEPISHPANTLSTSKESLELLARISLDRALASGSTIEFPQYAKPKISILLVLHNRAELTLQCLYSILRGDIESFEVVIVDNASTDGTKQLLKRIKGARIIENETNEHFLRACNQVRKHLRGEYVLLLNNDAQLLPGSVTSALRTLESSSDIGAVGGKIVLPDGTLQEAGSIIWRDGSCLGYGRGDSPFAPPYMFRRDVDYCSGAFLLTKRSLFVGLGGFDEDYAPAYYEETDYCVRLWKQNKRVVYDPNAVVLHYEFGSSGSSDAAIGLQREHQNVFVTKHRDWLQLQCKAEPENILPARTHIREGQRRTLFLDDRVPHLALGSGFPRSNRILFELVNIRHAVTFYPTNFPEEDWADVYQDIPGEVEVMLNHGWDRLEEFFEKRANYYDLIFVSRPHNMARLKSLFAARPDLCRNSKVIYDAEALFSYRDIEQHRLEGKELSPGDQQNLIDEEVLLAENCECVVSVSSRESQEFSKRGLQRVHTLGHALEISPTENVFEQRRDILFVGAVHSLTSPNADSMYWFSEQILPLVQEKLGADVRLIIAGSAISSFHDRLSNGNVKVVGRVDQLSTYYNSARLFVAPTRFSAGIPLKVIEAAAHGLPVVATKLTGIQLGWVGDHELLLADDPKSFAAACVTLYEDVDLWKRLRQNALKRVQKEYSLENFSRQLKEIIGSVNSF